METTRELAGSCNIRVRLDAAGPSGRPEPRSRRVRPAGGKSSKHLARAVIIIHVGAGKTSYLAGIGGAREFQIIVYLANICASVRPGGQVCHGRQTKTSGSTRLGRRVFRCLQAQAICRHKVRVANMASSTSSIYHQLAPFRSASRKTNPGQPDRPSRSELVNFARQPSAGALWYLPAMIPGTVVSPSESCRRTFGAT